MAGPALGKLTRLDVSRDLFQAAVWPLTRFQACPRLILAYLQPESRIRRSSLLHSSWPLQKQTKKADLSAISIATIVAASLLSKYELIANDNVWPSFGIKQMTKKWYPMPQISL